jgi:hypothetical protein
VSRETFVVSGEANANPTGTTYYLPYGYASYFHDAGYLIPEADIHAVLGGSAGTITAIAVRKFSNGFNDIGATAWDQNGSLNC